MNSPTGFKKEEKKSMKKMLFITALAVTVLLSCQKEKTTQEEVVLPDSDYPILKASIVSTKTTIDGLAISFETGDEIAVFNGVKESDTHLPTRYSCTAISGSVAYFVYSPSGTDDAEIVPDAELANVVATYPYRSPSTGAFEEYGTGTLKIRMTATGSTSSTTVGFIKTSLPLVASAAKDATLSFKQTAGLLRVNMKGTATISSVSMTSNQNISGDASVSYSVAEPVLSVVGTGKNITYTYSSGVTLNESTGVELYFGLPAGTHNVTFVFTDSEGKTMTRLASGLEIKRGYITPSSLTYSPDVEPVVNLSEGSKYANCYVVKAKGSYCFDARKPDGTLVSGASAKWIWASGEACNGASDLPSTMMTDVAYADDKVSFTVPASYKVGNVVLGVLDGSSNILYTWHVWLTSGDIGDITSNGITLMDRNLGAGAVYDVSLATNLPLQNGKGCFYQWGRKDPVLGARNSASSAEGTAFGTTNSQYTIVNSDAGITNVSAWGLEAFNTFTVEAGAAKPVTMGNGPKVKPGYIEGDTSSWSARTNANPCPYGYRPINQTEMTTLHDAGDPAISNYNNFGQVNLGGVIFARAGYRGGTDAKAKEGSGTSTSTARYWTDTASSDSQGILAKVTWSNNTTLATSWWSLAGFNANHACNVRCVKQ